MYYNALTRKKKKKKKNDGIPDPYFILLLKETIC